MGGLLLSSKSSRAASTTAGGCARAQREWYCSGERGFGFCVFAARGVVGFVVVVCFAWCGGWGGGGYGGDNDNYGVDDNIFGVMVMMLLWLW